jgi:hypothetical protein
MSHHETPQQRERQQKQLLHSPLTPPISTPAIYLPLWQRAPKRYLILLRWRGGIRRRGRDSLQRLNWETRDVVLIRVITQTWPSWRRGTSRRWRRWSRTRPCAWSRSMSGLWTWKLLVGGGRWRDLLSDNSKIVILLTRTLCLRCSEAQKRRRHPRTG